MSGLFSRILVAVDGSEPAIIAAAVGARLAREHGGELSLCFCANWKPLIAQFESIGAVVDPTPTIDALKERGRRLLREATAIAARSGVKALARTAAGDPAVTIPELARETASTLIVMGTHDGAGVQRLLVGSTTNAVLRRSCVPVLTVRPGIVLADETRRCFQRILVATDGSDRSAGAVETAVTLAPEDRRELVFCSVAEAGRTSVGEAQAAVERALDHACAHGARAQGRVLAGSPGVVLPEAAQSARADLIVLGAHGCGEAAHDVLGSVAERIVRTAPLPVLIVRTTPAIATRAAARQEGSLV